MLQVDGASEFLAEFELTCAKRGIRLLCLLPRSSNLSGHVEPAHRTHSQGFQNLCEDDLDLASVEQVLRWRQHTFNRIAPHQSLDGTTPAECTLTCHLGLVPFYPVSHMS